MPPTRKPVHAGSTTIELRVAAAETSRGTFVQVRADDGSTAPIRAAMTFGSARELALHLLDETIADDFAAVRLVAERFGVEINGPLGRPAPPLPTHDGSVIRFRSADEDGWETAVIIAGQWKYPHSGGRARPTTDWELLYDARP